MKTMSPRTGRPSSDPKRTQISLRLSDDDLEKLEYCHAATGIPKQQIIREGIDLVYRKLTEQDDKKKE